MIACIIAKYKLYYNSSNLLKATIRHEDIINKTVCIVKSAMQIKLVRISGFNHYTVSVNADLFWPYMILQDIKSTVLSWQLEVAGRRDLHSLMRNI